MNFISSIRKAGMLLLYCAGLAMSALETGCGGVITAAVPTPIVGVGVGGPGFYPGFYGGASYYRSSSYYGSWHYHGGAPYYGYRGWRNGYYGCHHCHGNNWYRW